MYLCAMEFSIGKANGGETLEFPPSAWAEDPLESVEFTDLTANCDELNLVDLADDIGRSIHRAKMMLHVGGAT